MLILTRKLGERLNIGDEITVKVLSIRGKQVRLGLEAPDDLPIHREEVYENILRERQEPQSESAI